MAGVRRRPQARGEDSPKPSYIVRFEEVPVLNLDDCSKATIELHSLVHHQYLKVEHSGDFLVKKIVGSDWWSDRSWGTALDESPRDGMPNDALFDWEVRMLRTGNAEADYIIGSLEGSVMEASAPDWTISPSDAANSHTWHVHTSVEDHNGVKPSSA